MVFFVAASAAVPVLAQNAAKTTDVEIVGHVYEPAKLEPTDEPPSGAPHRNGPSKAKSQCGSIPRVARRCR